MEYGTLTDIAKKLGTTKKHVCVTRKRAAEGKTVRSQLGKRILKELKKAQ